MTTFVNNDVASGATIYASDHNEQGSRIAAVINGGIDSTNLADASVTTAKILDSNVTTAKIADSAVTDEKRTSTVSFLARRTADQSGLSTGVPNKVQFNVEIFDTGSDFDNATNYRFVAPYKGVYHFDSHISIDASGSLALIYLYVNGAVSASDRAYNHTSTDDQCARISIDLQLNASDYAEIFVLHDAGSNRSLLGSNVGENYFSGHLVGRVA